MPITVFFYRVTKGFKFHARPQTGAYSCFFSYAGILIFDTFPVSTGEFQGGQKVKLKKVKKSLRLSKLGAGLLLELGDA